MSDAIPRIELPADLRPSDGRFGSGPSKVRQSAVEALYEAAPTLLGTSHRRPKVKQLVGRIRSGLRDLFSLPDDYEVVLGNGGTTAFWDAAVFGLIDRRSAHASFGEFSSKFAAVAAGAPHLEDPVVVESAPGTHPSLEADPSVDVYALTHNETSTGVCMPVSRPGDDGLVVVDATSAAGGLRVDPSQFDVYYFAPQKVFGSEGGLWVALCSPAAVERIERIAGSDRWIPPFLDLKTALDNSRQDQTYNTPAVATLFLLADQVDWLNGNGGLEWAASRCDRSAEIVYGWADDNPLTTAFVADRAQRSHTVATVDLADHVPAATVSGVLRANGILDTESYRKLGRNQLRIAMFPNVEPDDLYVLTRAVDHIAAELASLHSGTATP